jgi:hypothetical protein
MLRVTAGHDIEYPLRSAGSAVAYYLQDGKEPPGVWAGTAAGVLGLIGGVDPEVYQALFGKLIAPTGERLYSGRPPRYAAETGRDKDEEAAAAVAALGEFATPAEARRTRAKVLGSTGAAVPFYDLTFSATKSVSLLLDPAELRWVLVEATGRVLPELDERLGQWTLRALRRRGVDVRLHTRLASAANGTVLLDDGTELAAGTLVWAAGVRPSPLGAAAGLPVDKAGRIRVGADLAVTGVPGVFAAGDVAAVPDLSRPGEFCAPNAQHAVRQSKVLARNIVAFGRGGQLKRYRHAYVGSVAGLGHHQGVAQVYRIRLTGFAGWLAHRVYHLFWVPTFSHKARVLADWTLALFFRRETAQLSTLEHPADDFRDALRAA